MLTAGDVLLTLDTDWAPDFAIDFTAAVLRRHEVRATWFITHRSAAIDRLRECPLFEIGVHPNFLPGSSHGTSTADVLAHCAALAPGAAAFRTHGLHQSTRLLLDVMELTPLRIDASAWLPGVPFARPAFWAGKNGRIVRVPLYWEDDLEMESAAPSWQFRALTGGDGLRVLNFHPIHVFLNSATMERYGALQRAAGDVRNAAPALAEEFRNDGAGTATLFGEAADFLSGGGSRTLSELAAEHLHSS